MNNDNNPYASGPASGNYQMNYQNSGEQSGAKPQAAAQSSSAPAEAIADITTAQFGPMVVETSKSTPVLVDFWAPWCGPCKQLTPILEKVITEYAGQVKLVKMNIDDHPEIPGQMGIQSIPAVVAFVDGKPADAFMGAQSESQVKAFIEKMAGPPAKNSIADLLAQIRELIVAGDTVSALEIVTQILDADEANPVATALLASIYLKNNDLERAENIASSIASEHHALEDVSALLAAIELTKAAGEVGELDELRRKVDSSPNDPQSRFDLALALNANNERENAAELLLEIITNDRQWNDDGARLQLLKFFEAWGNTDPATLSARRKLSSALFS